VDIEQRRLKMMVKKNQRALSIPLNDAAFGVVESRLGNQHGPYVFYSPMTGDRYKDVKGAMAAAVKRAGLGKVTWHMFRHTFASRLTRSGVDIVTVKDLLGHSNISTTLRYAHSNDDAKRRAVSRLGTSDKVVTIVPRRAKKANML
jgi:integrase